MANDLLDRFRSAFDTMVVYKDLKNSNFFSTLGLPSFLRDWLLQKFQDEDGNYSASDIAAFVSEFIPQREDWTAIKDQIIKGYEKKRILARITVDINIANGEISFTLPDFDLTNKQTIIEDIVWERCKDELITGKETWGMLELGYRPPDDSARPKLPGKIKLLDFRNFCPYSIDLDYFYEVRKDFELDEWLNILLGAVDYNPQGYLVAKHNNPELPEIETMKLTFLSRLLPFIEKRLNMIELAPKGTGKSYLFGQVSRYGWLSTTNEMSRAKLFYDMGRREAGLIMQTDFLVMDEIHKIHFENSIGATLQGYLEQGSFSIGNYMGRSDCGMVLCGNVPPEIMREDGNAPMFENLPPVFQDAAMIDRFHGFIKGWNIPRMNDDLKIVGWALNSEYFSAIMHALRDDSTYRAIVDELLITPPGADTRDTEAIKRLTTALLKLLFPHVRTAGDIPRNVFERYCLRPASTMRYIIKLQLGMKDVQFKKEVPHFQIKEFRPR